MDSHPPSSYSSRYTLSSRSRSSAGLSPKSRVLSFISVSFHLSPDPRLWGTNLDPDTKEPDDAIHDPKELIPSGWLHQGIDYRCVNLGCLLILVFGLLTLFAGYPLISYFSRHIMPTNGGFNLGGINASGQLPMIHGYRSLIDVDTPKGAYTKPSWNGGADMELVFSDEFNVPGRTFWPGDDPYWEAVNLHYWATNNLEWYDPEALKTKDGYLEVTLSRKDTHNLNYQGAVTMTRNKFCFTGGYIEVNVSLPGVPNVMGLWPAIWTLGNLGRAGYGASLDGMWPYTYDACDVGTVANQTVDGLPVAATVNGDKGKGGILSWLPGQKLSRCTCPGESHPGPIHNDGSYVGRSAPEIDVFEAQASDFIGQVSQSAQWAPFNAGYIWQNTSQNEVIRDPTISVQNTYIGSVLQQATSVVTTTDPNCYEGTGGCFSIYGFEYVPGFDNAYITWVSNNQVAWTLNVAGMGADSAVQISARPVPQEPMYIIVDLGMSTNFGPVDLDHLPFPVHMRVDYVRVYQPKDKKNIGCDPKDFPTAEYINTYIEAYTNPNLTTWTNDYDQPFPKNRFLGQC
ncbi:glycoside hydrolase family 16 protein [Scleroderma citrinum Foug A]|uniref:Glycoside hydrolase family 16 protein n=1 Tax=Scleroderma citrinum Foug A TaxID=1036808 RepID=A0A0C3AVD5_9AGAM|nr:glycoside hydrolase family 16 protein [Scleroderma citrinum Foug A]